jgi:hypothetical protein
MQGSMFSLFSEATIIPHLMQYDVVRAMILSLGRFEIAGAQQAQVLERMWASYRNQNQLDLYGKAISAERRAKGCGYSNLR